MTQLSINTTQNVNINFTAASLGERLLAFLVDFAIIGAYLITVFWVIFSILGFADVVSQMDQWSQMAIQGIIFLPIMVYTLTLESIFEGQTIGKRLLKIKVVKIDGYQASFGDYFIRWIFRLVDIQTNFGVIGLVAIVTSQKAQRLGDMSAGTAVITLKNNVTINSTILEDLGTSYVPIYPAVIKLSDNDMRIIKDTFDVAKKSRDAVILVKLRQKIETVAGIKNQSGNDEDFIRTILKDYNYYTQNM